jgi:hypothetical protein
MNAGLFLWVVFDDVTCRVRPTPLLHFVQLDLYFIGGTLAIIPPMKWLC